MANVNSDTLDAVRTNFQAIFMQALGDKAKSLDQVKRVATTMPSTGSQNSYNWFGITPPMSEWKDRRRMDALTAYNYTLKNKDWANGIEVDRNAIADDLLGMYPPRVRGLANAYYRAVIREVFKALSNAAAGLAYDGLALCVDTRVIGKSANIDNYMGGAYSESEAEIRQAIDDAYGTMIAFQDDFGEPLGLVPDTIVCAPSMLLPIRQALKPGVALTVRPEAELINPDNVFANPYITAGSNKDWFIMCTTEEFKPVLLQERQAPQFAALDKMTDVDVFKQKRFLYGVDARFVVGYGDPRTVIMVHDTSA